MSTTFYGHTADEWKALWNSPEYRASADRVYQELAAKESAEIKAWLETEEGNAWQKTGLRVL